MEQSEIIRMAREVWGERAVLPFNDLERFADLVAAHEREACAKMCEETELAFDIAVWCDSTKKEMTVHTANGLAAAIRARSIDASR